MKIASKLVNLQVEVIATGLHHPWAIALLPDGQFLVTERDYGRVRVGGNNGSLSAPLDGAPAVFRFHGDEGSQAGMFDIKLDPGFSQNQLVYISYSKPTDAGAAVAIDRARLVLGDNPRLADVQTIFELNKWNQDSSSLHFGGRMAFHPEDGTLFLTVGDRRNMNRAQKLDDQAGSILRMNRDGAAPADNPFTGQEGADPYLYSYGHRNGQGLTFRPGNHELWENEHGPQGGDELNRIEPGGNYGWPLAGAGLDYSDAQIGAGPELDGTIAAFHYFAGTVSPSGLAFVTGAEFPEWEGDLLTGGLMSEGIVRQRLGESEALDTELISLDARIRDIQLAPDGSIWLVTDYADGAILRLSRQ